jgi:hypothetical protein
LELMLVNLKLPKFQSIEYGDDESVVVENSRAFGFENFILFFDTKDEFVNNIWVNVPFGTGSANYDAILNVLYDLGESYDLIMMDWNSDRLVDLKNRTDIRKYLNKSLNIKLP